MESWVSVSRMAENYNTDMCVTIRSRKTLFFNVTPDIGITLT